MVNSMGRQLSAFAVVIMVAKNPVKLRQICVLILKHL